MILPHRGIDSNGTKTPLMKTRGNLTREDNIITVAGVSEGGDDRRAPRDEKQNEEIKIPKSMIGRLTKETPANMPTTTGIVDMNRPKMAEASTSPQIIVVTVTGAEINLSSVLIRVSQGAITGTTDVEVKKTAIPSMPGIRKSKGSSRPIEKARNRKRGNRRPNITTGPLK